jgi:hypothetical protein
MRVFIGSDPRSEPDYEAVLSKIPAGYTRIPWGAGTTYGSLNVDDYLLERNMGPTPGAPKTPLVRPGSQLLKVIAKIPIMWTPPVYGPTDPEPPDEPSIYMYPSGPGPLPPLPLPEGQAGFGQAIRTTGGVLMVVANYLKPEEVGKTLIKPDAEEAADGSTHPFLTIFKAPVLSKEEQVLAAEMAKKEIIEKFVPAGFIPVRWRGNTDYGELNVGDYLVSTLDPEQYGGGLPKNFVLKVNSKEVVKDKNGNNAEAVSLSYLYNDTGPAGLSLAMHVRAKDPNWRNIVTYRRPNPPSSDVREAGMVAASGDWPIPPGVVIGVIVVGLGLWYFLKNRPK